MRTLVDIPERQLAEINNLSAARKLPRAEIIRQALTAYLEANKPADDGAFGLWKQQGVDGLAYQEQVRSEW